ncbi:hypothetical protein CRG98_038960 [Punica granatum]|uniref:Uncharacterized protein n=1 Tax=Punica granatum TaxID=22663 RepID=A0A2I0I9F3_PUNGR|nr:hypothetical protein CRG98_038960 [Punica granatum]
MTPYARLSQLFSQFRVDSDRHLSESMVLAFLSPPSLELVHSSGDPLLSRSSVCSSFRPYQDPCAPALDQIKLPARSAPYDPQQKMSLATRRGHSPCCGSLRSVPGLG